MSFINKSRTQDGFRDTADPLWDGPETKFHRSRAKTADYMQPERASPTKRKEHQEDWHTLSGSSEGREDTDPGPKGKEAGSPAQGCWAPGLIPGPWHLQQKGWAKQARSGPLLLWTWGILDAGDPMNSTGHLSWQGELLEELIGTRLQPMQSPETLAQKHLQWSTTRGTHPLRLTIFL